MIRRWRYRTSRVARLRAAVYAKRCHHCHRDDWDFVQLYPVGDVMYLLMRCNGCGHKELRL